MRRAALIALAALPLLGFDCGSSDPVRTDPYGCTVTVGGEVSEELWCIVTVFDYSQLTPEFPEFVFELVAYRGGVEAMEVAAGAAFFLPARASTGVAYGWDAATPWSNVDAGDATRYELDPEGFEVPTHSAEAPLTEFDVGTGRLSVTLTRIPAASATGAELLGVDGMLSATLPSTTGGAPVTFTATF